MALSDSAGVGSALPSQVGVTSGWALTTDGTSASWASVGGGGGVTTMAAVGSSPSANGASISGVTLTLQPADATHPGVVTTGTQTIAGAKTFTSPLVVSDGATNSIKTLAGPFPGLWLESATPDATNFALASFGGERYLNSNTGSIYFQLVNVNKMVLSGSALDLTGLGTGGAITIKDTVGGTVRTLVVTAGALVIT